MSRSPRRSSAKVLRVFVVVDDQVCEDLHQTDPKSVTVGNNYRSDVMLWGRGVPDKHRLFQYHGGHYYIDVPPGTKGKLQLGKKPATVSQLRRRYGKNDQLRLRLPSGSKGKLRFGHSTLAFRFSRPKPRKPLLPFPKQFKAKWWQMWERRFRHALATSAVLLGALFIYLALMELPANLHHEVPERFAVAMQVPEEKEVLPEEEPEEEMLAQEDEVKDKKEDKPEPDKKVKEKPEKYSKQAMKQARNVGIARVLGVYSENGEGTVFDVIQSTENNLDDLFAQGMTTTVLADGGDITPFVPGGEGISLRGNAVANDGLNTGGGPALDKKAQKRERKVRGRAKATKTEAFGGGDKKSLRAFINRRTSALQHCYEKALRGQPGLEGKMTYTIDISVMGGVTRVAVEEDTLGHAAVKGCTKGKIKGWRFPMAGAEEPAEVTFSVVFSGG